MFLLLASCIGALTVPLTGGRLARLADVELRLPFAPLAAIGLQAAIAAAAGGLPILLGAVHLLSYGVAVAFVVANRGLAGMVLLGLGGALNAVAVAANRGVMPASPAAVARSGLAHQAGRFHNSDVVDGARLQLLGDVFAIPASWPLSNVFSIGDVLLFLGGILVIHALAGSPWTRHVIKVG